MLTLYQKLVIFIKDLFVKENIEICSTCKIGAYYFGLDKSDVFCPLIECHKGSYCSAHESLLTILQPNKIRSRKYVKPDVIICDIGNYKNKIVKF